MPWAQIHGLVLAPAVRDLCRRRYPGHAKGCPNYGQKPGCPPTAPMLGEVLDVGRPLYAVWNVFDFGGHVARMREKHPAWSSRQLACCLYWQQGARKKLLAEVRAVAEELKLLGTFKVVTTPEACGVNVTETMRSIGIELEWPVATVAYQVALVGSSAGIVEPAPCEGQQGLFS